MRNYDQPDFYHFSQDSILLAKYIRENYKKNIFNVLEIGTGCGVISFELHDLGIEYNQMTCLESQLDFKPYFDENKKRFCSSADIIFIHQDFLSWQTDSKYDLIYFNPPYFLSGHGKESLDKKRQNCRSISQDDLIQWFQKSLYLLSTKGQLYFCLNSNSLKDLNPIIESIFSDKIRSKQFGNCIIFYLSDFE